MAHDLCVNIDDTAPYEWRHNVGPAVRALHPSGLNLQHVYQFGVFAGNSMRQLNKMLRPHTLWGIDSFEGLPKTQQPNIHDWRAGAWAADPRNASWPHNVRWVAGWYDQLDDALVSTLGMQPAAYVDIDCDLYDSARAALDFAFRNRLIAEGTLVGYEYREELGGAYRHKYKVGSATLSVLLDSDGARFGGRGGRTQARASSGKAGTTEVVVRLPALAACVVAVDDGCE